MPLPIYNTSGDKNSFPLCDKETNGRGYYTRAEGAVLLKRAATALSPRYQLQLPSDRHIPIVPDLFRAGSAPVSESQERSSLWIPPKRELPFPKRLISPKTRTITPEITPSNQRALAAGPDSKRGIVQDSDRKSTRLNSSHLGISYAVFC